MSDYYGVLSGYFILCDVNGCDQTLEHCGICGCFFCPVHEKRGDDIHVHVTWDDLAYESSDFDEWED